MSNKHTVFSAAVIAGFLLLSCTQPGFSESKTTILSMHNKYDKKLIEIKTGKVVTEIQKDKITNIQQGMAKRQVQPKESDVIYMKGKKDDQPEKAPEKVRKVGGFTILK